jgi:hypothetical protein
MPFAEERTVDENKLGAERGLKDVVEEVFEGPVNDRNRRRFVARSLIKARKEGGRELGVKGQKELGAPFEVHVKRPPADLSALGDRFDTERSEARFGEELGGGNKELPLLGVVAAVDRFGPIPAPFSIDARG